MLSCRKRDSFKRKTGKKINYFRGAKKLKKKQQWGSNSTIELGKIQNNSNVTKNTDRRLVGR